MAGETLRVRYQRGEAVLELEGDAQSVLAELAALHAQGFGPLNAFFGLSAPGLPPPPGQPPPALPPPPPPLPNPALTLGFVLNQLRLPVHPSDDAVDIDGDGKPDNQLGSVFVALANSGLDLQSGIDGALTDGSLVVLAKLATEQAVLTVDQRADLTLVRGVKTASGFAIAPGAAAVTLTGQIAAGRFTSFTPQIGSVAPTFTLDLPFGGSVTIRFAIEAPRVSCMVSATQLSGGVLAGSVPQAAVQRDVVAGLAALLTARIAADPQSSVSRQIAQIFDIGGCTNPDGSVAHAGDGVIDVCEVGTNPLIRTMLSPDVQIHDTGGGFRPVPGGASPDSLSLGLGFTATVTTF